MSENMWNDVSKPEVDALLRLQNTASADSEPAGTLDNLRAELDAERAARAKAEADAAALKEIVAKWVYVTITGHRYLSDDHGEVLKTVEESTAGAALLERLATLEAALLPFAEMVEVDDSDGRRFVSVAHLPMKALLFAAAAALKGEV